MPEGKPDKRKGLYRQIRPTGPKLAQDEWKPIEGRKSLETDLDGLGEAILAPTPERTRQGEVELSTRQIIDEHGDIAVPFRATSVAGSLFKKRHIDVFGLQAAEEFGKDFYLAGLNGLQASRFERLGHSKEFLTERRLKALQRLYKAQIALGGIGSSCERAAWYVLGMGFDMTQYCQIERINDRIAKGILIGAIGVLSKHYGYSI